jgi:hypothetical protein
MCNARLCTLRSKRLAVVWGASEGDPSPGRAGALQEGR